MDELLAPIGQLGAAMAALEVTDAAAEKALQEVLAGEQLSALELSEGLIRIQGTSSDPQAILQRLEQDPLITEVVFSRATSNTRYYIDLRLATVNFEAYRVRHFPDET